MVQDYKRQLHNVSIKARRMRGRRGTRRRKRSLSSTRPPCLVKDPVCSTDEFVQQMKRKKVNFISSILLNYFFFYYSNYYVNGNSK